MTTLLVERHTRGLGDAVMLSSVISSLRHSLDDPHVTVSIREGLLPTFLHNPDIDHLTTPTHVDRDVDVYADCSTSAAAYETGVQPNVEKNRPQAWTEALGYEWDRSPPKLYLSRSEWEFSGERRWALEEPIIGVGYKSVDEWRNYPHIDLLIRKLSKAFGTVVVFHDKTPSPAASARAELCVGEPLRDYIAQVAMCDVLVSPDTAHVHVAAALGVPVYFIDGPTDAKVRMDGYAVDYARPSRYTKCGRQPSWYKPCQPCWCLWALPPKEIVRGVEQIVRDSGGGFAQRVRMGLDYVQTSGEG